VFGGKHRAEKQEQVRAAEDARNRAQLREAIEKLIPIAEGEEGTSPDSTLVLKPGERLVSMLSGVGIFEPRREPGHWAGRSTGVSVPVGHSGVRVRLGQSAGTYVQGEEKPTVIDTGMGSITTQRVVFQGSKYTREWLFSKLIGMVHYSDQPCTAIQVSNRQKTSGFSYPGVNPESVHLALVVAIAIFKGESDKIDRELKDELAELDAAALPGPMWAADPTGRHQVRWWDGKVWTEDVGDAGRESQDPLPGPPS
jgi:Protein of unknown function (DUF2510)